MRVLRDAVSTPQRRIRDRVDETTRCPDPVSNHRGVVMPVKLLNDDFDCVAAKSGVHALKSPATSLILRGSNYG
jgi:hypothetical protein